MFHLSRSPVVRNVVAAAVVGTAGGALAGLWSVRHERSKVAPVQTSMKTAVVGSSSTSPDQSATVPGAPKTPAASASGAPSTTAAAVAPTQPRPADEDLLQRARSLARRPDVKALVELRESLVQRAEERGEKESPETKRLLDEVDRYLAEARALRLKLDALEFKNASADGSRPR
jgi:hypothetical protein